jgi:H+/Cl- antiporter ClcA
MKFTIICVTFCIFATEALLHYHVGKHGALFVSPHFPSFRELVYIVMIVALFSTLNGLVLAHILHKSDNMHIFHHCGSCYNQQVLDIICPVNLKKPPLLQKICSHKRRI